MPETELTENDHWEWGAAETGKEAAVSAQQA